MAWSPLILVACGAGGLHTLAIFLEEGKEVDFRIEACRLHGIEITGGHRNDPMIFILALEVGRFDKIQLVPTHNDST